ncbi:hypothetical protein [Streptomyces sp. WAC01280]|uniref:hypothetical protein n=1 Tax=Streptomyces sp. WAC01280 TaxID=2487424 RepID=UPI000F77D72C|nr:hypothetical protein [Streptomyces sp. WAC01280]RSS51384.1 hypothetical protein EF909_34390 [Streptomyces sp. WAC01280]
MTHIPDAIAVASSRTHRLILTVDNDGIAETRSNLSRPDVAHLLRTLADGFAPVDTETTCLDELFTGRPCSAHDSTTEQDPTTADDPTPLRWGLDDVLHGDDDTVTVCLSGPGPDRAPYALELDPERAEALRAALAPLDGRPTPSEAALARILAWCECLDRGARERNGIGHPYAAAIRSLIPSGEEPVTAHPFATGFRLHLRHGAPLDGVVLPSGRCLVVEDGAYGLFTAAPSLEDLVRGYPDARIEWPAVTAPQEGAST